MNSIQAGKGLTVSFLGSEAKTGKFIIQWWAVHRKEGVAQRVADLDRVSLIEEEYARYGLGS